MTPRAPDTFPPDRGVGRLDYSQAPAAIYYVAEDGGRWRVHDCVFERGKLRRVGTPGASSGGDHRVFVNELGVKRTYRRTTREQWDLTEAHLDRRLAAAEFLPTEAYDPSERTA